MDRTFWHKQTPEAPLFPDLLWSRPENRRTAGKLLIAGGNQYGFVAPAETYTYAEKAGIGTARMLLPDSLRPFVGKTFTAGELAPSTPSGSFSQKALAELLAMANWADGVLFAGDLGRNSETAILLEMFLNKHTGQVTLTKDTIEYITLQPNLVQERSDTLLVLSFSQLQKLATAMHFPMAFTFDMDLLRLVDVLHALSQEYPFTLITKHLGNIFVAHGRQVSSTRINEEEKVWRLKTAAQAATWWLQNSSKPFEAFTTAVFEANK